MDRICSTLERPYSEVRYVAVAIQMTEIDQFHLGILHKGDNSVETIFLDLAMHYQLRNEISSQDYLWVDISILAIRARHVAAKCRRIWKANKSRRYPLGLAHLRKLLIN
jgi:hypothetical protein